MANSVRPRAAKVPGQFAGGRGRHSGLQVQELGPAYPAGARLMSQHTGDWRDNVNPAASHWSRACSSRGAVFLARTLRRGQLTRRQSAPSGRHVDSKAMPPAAARGRCVPGHPEARAGKALVVNVAGGENVLEQRHARKAQATVRRSCPATGANYLLDVGLTDWNYRDEAGIRSGKTIHHRRHRT